MHHGPRISHSAVRELSSVAGGLNWKIATDMSEMMQYVATQAFDGESGLRDLVG